MRVLVIEDDALLCWLLEKIMNEKYEVICMNNGMDAWSWLSEGNACDLIISDINMPSVSGIELLENLRSSGLFHGIPVIILSGCQESRAQCLELGARSYLIKPFEPRKLLSEVEFALEKYTEKAFDAK